MSASALQLASGRRAGVLRPVVFLLVCCALGLLLAGPLTHTVHAWAIGTGVKTLNHHGDLAEKAVSCLKDKDKLFPRNCRRERIVNDAYLFGELRRGAREPDLFDGASSSKHSLNPRYNDGMDRPILAAYGPGIGIVVDARNVPQNIRDGKAPDAIADEEKTIATLDIPLLNQLCNKPSTAVQRYGFFWKDLGRLSHYIADSHSPFHPNSFGLNPQDKSDDYHEGVMDPASGTWLKGLWDRDGVLHMSFETAMGAYAGIAGIACEACDGPEDPKAMAEEAAAAMDEYVSRQGRNGYAGLLDDVFTFPNSPNNTVMHGWGKPRASRAIGSIGKYFNKYVDQLPSQPCPGTGDCDPKPGPGGDNPDDNAASATPGSALADTVDRTLTAFDRLAAKKNKKQLWGWQLAVAWEYERRYRQFPEVQFDAYMTALAYRSDDAAYFRDYVASPDVSVLATGFAVAASDVVEKSLAEPIMRVPPGEVDRGHLVDHPALLIPSGGLSGLVQNAQFKQGLDAYVASGGTAVVFSQQHGLDYSVLPTPDGRPIGAWGWFEDNSCYFNGAYIDTFHPILASQSSALVTSAIDGYFDSIPDNSIVLLRRVKNGMPAMFMYPYGQGWVIVTSSYDDWGGFNQSGPGARAIIRDAIAWAKKPADLPLNAPGSTVSISLQVRNITDLAASQVKLVLMSPSRDRVLAEQTVGVAVGAGETVEVPFSYPFPVNAALGIYHLDYELLDGAGVTIQPVAEEDTGRIVVAQPPSAPFLPQDLTASTTLPGGEDVYVGEPTVFRYRVFNPSAVDRHVKLYWNVNFATNGTDPALLDDLVVPARGSVAKQVTLTLSGSWLSATFPQRFWLYAFEPGGTPKPEPWWLWLFRFPPDRGAFQSVDRKGFVLHVPRMGVGATADRPQYGPGQSVTLAVSLTNQDPRPLDGRIQVAEARSGTVVADVPFSVAANSSGTFPLTFAAPSILGAAPYRVSALSGRVVGFRETSVQVVAGDLRGLGLDVPAWSRTSSNVVSWELRNAAGVPTEGTLTARLEWAGPAWEQTQPLGLSVFTS